MLRRTCGIGTIALLAASLAACATEPEPAWTEEEAYAAAEETFRGYWSTGFSKSNADPTDYLTGEMLAYYDDSEGGDISIETRGKANVASFEPSDFTLVGESASLKAVSCIDASTLRIENDAGDWVKPREESYYGVEMIFATVDGAMLIEHFTESEDLACEP